MTDTLSLVIGDKNLSSWSLRPWLVLRHFGITFDEVRLPLDTPEFHRRIPSYSPSGRVPVLLHGELVVWDSLAILEYINETFLVGRGWPRDAAARAIARAVSAEMHSGFAALRTQLPMNCRLRTKAVPDASAQRDIERVAALWRNARERFGASGAFLFGDFCIADAMFAPVVARFVSYGIEVGVIERDYMNAILSLPAMKRWFDDAAAEVAAPARSSRNI
ncbi:glutathione S-transferase family protein [Pseudolysobacter antarcticus]|uniref:Glutathione S-transferase family protein n=1 Tax=Pseudolysobacter antarcticus TaxID=2511995 RepID=A0A411HMD4_9GAMM|nr:glutathione S-transferase family protein [Pseudolysobacter antarcticus]QBB71653.1 glutathione S-transferase family protein [Pseudolysobacter antarcticus]